MDLKGDAYSIGVAQGKETLKSRLPRLQLEQLREMASGVVVEVARGSLQRLSPHLLDELAGMAEGLEMDTDEIVRLYSGYDLAFPSMGCTALIQNGYYVRNYDFSPEFYDARLVFTQPEVGYSSVGFSQQVIGRLDGMNEKGFVVGLHFVNSEHRGEGFFATTIVRMLLDHCATVEEAIEWMKVIPHGYCYNYSMTDAGGMTVIIETSPDRQVLTSANPAVCTNHFTSPELIKLNREAIGGSIARMRYVGSMLDENVTPFKAYDLFNNIDSPLFYKDYTRFFGTLHTVVYSPEDLSLLAGIGGSCEPVRLSLQEYLDKESKLPDGISGMISS